MQEEIHRTIEDIVLRTREGLPHYVLMQLLVESEDQLLELQQQFADGCICENFLEQQEHIVESYSNQANALAIHVRHLEKCLIGEIKW